jgi:hypothetical protein
LRIKMTTYSGGMPHFEGGTLIESRAGGGRSLLSVSAALGQVLTSYNTDGTMTQSYVVFITTDGMPVYNPQLTFWDQTTNSTIAVPVTTGSPSSGVTQVTILPAVDPVVSISNVTDIDIRTILGMIAAVVAVDIILFLSVFAMWKDGPTSNKNI